MVQVGQVGDHVGGTAGTDSFCVASFPQLDQVFPRLNTLFLKMYLSLNTYPPSDLS